jgi:DNA-directed RNA polymerase subunit RPC12/RpoP
MKLLTLSCNECGAPLEVPAETKFVTCGYCSARLSVQRTSSAVYTEVIEKIGEQTEKLAKDVEILKLQNELARIDREWSDQRERHMVSGKHGRHEPGSADVIAPVLVSVVAVVITFGMLASPAPGTALFGLLFIVFGIVMAVANAGKANAYSQAREQYEWRRGQLLTRLRQHESADSPFTSQES